MLTFVVNFKIKLLLYLGFYLLVRQYTYLFLEIILQPRLPLDLWQSLCLSLLSWLPCVTVLNQPFGVFFFFFLLNQYPKPLTVVCVISQLAVFLFCLLSDTQGYRHMEALILCVTCETYSSGRTPMLAFVFVCSRCLEPLAHAQNPPYCGMLK